MHKYFDEYELGEKIKSKWGRTITETDVVQFMMITGNWYPLHSDVEYCKKKTRWGERIVQGSLLFSISAGMQEMNPDVVVANYGYDKIRFFAPTKIGDTVRLESEVIDLKEKDENTGVVAFRNTLINQRDESVCVIENKVLFNKKPK